MEIWGWRSNGFKTVMLCLLLFCLTFVSWTTESLAAELIPPDLPIAPPSRSTLNANAISSEKISQFIQAYLKVLALIEQREGELQSAETESESLQVQQDIEAAAFRIIQSAGLTEQEYLQLLGLANLDPEFGERIATQLQEATN